MSIISYKEEGTENDTLCFGEYHGIDLNGSFMKDSPELLLLVKKEIWHRDVPDSIRIIPYYWEYTPEQIEEWFKNQKN